MKNENPVKPRRFAAWPARNRPTPPPLRGSPSHLWLQGQTTD